jgi:hypothetical protein
MATYYFINKHLNSLTNSIFPNLYLKEPLTAPLHPGPTTVSPCRHAAHNSTSRETILTFWHPLILDPLTPTSGPVKIRQQQKQIK